MPSLDKNPFQEYWWNDHRYSPIAQPFHREILGALSAENDHPYGLPDAWGRMMNANRAHLVIMLREAGAGHYPFSDAEWPSTPAQVWENLAQMEQLPDLKGANLSRIDFKWADLASANLSGRGPVRDRPQMGRPNGRRPDGRGPVQRQPQLGQPDGRRPAGRGPDWRRPQPDKPDGRGPDQDQHGRGQPAFRLFGRPHQAGRSHRAGTLAHPTNGNQRVHQERRATNWEKTRPNRPARKERYNSHTPCKSKGDAATMTDDQRHKRPDPSPAGTP